MQAELNLDSTAVSSNSPSSPLRVEEPIRFSLIPAGDEQMASSRIRVYSLHRSLTELGHQAVLGHSPDSDVLYIQKRVSWETLEFARAAKAAGSVVLYDVDDYGGPVWCEGSERCFFEMIRLADAVTTDTDGHKEQLVHHYGARRVEIVPDCVDYHPSGPIRPPIREGTPLRVLWFGNCGNLHLFEKYSSGLADIPDLELVVATDQTALAEYSSRYPRITFVPWSPSSFLATLQSCDLSCLMHDGSDIDQAKSNNKMITSITWGVPAIVSRTPEYERTAREAGVEAALFSDLAGLRAAIDRLRPARARLSYLDKSQAQIWARYSPGKVADGFIKLAARYRGPKAASDTTPAGGHHEPGTSSLALKMKRRIEFESWRFQYGGDPIGVIKSLVHEVAGRSLRTVRRKDPAGTVSDSPPSAPSERNYMREWVNPEGVAYRMGAYERQRKGGTHPLVSNPTIDEVRAAFRLHQPESVLEVGCGWGRLLEELAEFDIEGCDVSQDMLELCPPGLRTFQADIAVENYSFVAKNASRWDLLFTRGLMCYFKDEPVHMAFAMNNMMMLASKKILIWEWPEVCDLMRRFSSSSKFEYHPIEHRDE